MLRLEGVGKVYGNLEVLRDVTLRVNRNEIVTIVGPSGAGKTTLLQIAGTLARPDTGKIIYGNDDISGMSDRKLSEFRNRNIGFIFQFHQLLPEFTARENVALPAMIGGMSRKAALHKADGLLESVGLSARKNHRPSEMSGGECQRTAVARALINDPEVVFADEPTGSLDSARRDEIKEIIAGLRRDLGQTFVIVTHDLSMNKIADRVIRMEDGRILN
ncbi:MAG: ABC transporter ATP-binding protein [Muribaculaceae bacterium]|nr:ABC transporter ATP-binding protein [Muribaculaceae bacterium]